MAKDTVLLILVLFLVFPAVIWGDGASTVSGFSNYINTPENPVDNSTDSTNKNIQSNSAVDNDNKPPANTEHKEAKQVLQAIPVKWQGCSQDSDCASGVVDCVSWEPINKKYLKELSGDLAACSASVDPGFQAVAVCVNQFCQTTEKTTDVSWEEWLKQMRKKKQEPQETK